MYDTSPMGSHPATDTDMYASAVRSARAFVTRSYPAQRYARTQADAQAFADREAATFRRMILDAIAEEVGSTVGGLDALPVAWIDPAI